MSSTIGSTNNNHTKLPFLVKQKESSGNNSETPPVITNNNQPSSGTSTIIPNNTPPDTSSNDANSSAIDSKKQLTPIDRLSKKVIDILWKLTVSDVAWYEKPIGLIYYAWYRSDAIAEDKRKGGATIDKFNKAAAELVKAIAARTLNPKEVQALGHPPLPFENAGKQLSAINLDLDAQNKLKAFYKVFKERVIQLNDSGDITENDQFILYASAAKKIIKDLSLSEKLTQGSLYSATLATKIKTTLRCFDEKTLKDVVDTYAAQPLADITIESFQKEAKKIRNLFKLDSIELESELRKAIINKHQKADFESIRGELLNPNHKNPLLMDAKEKIKTKLETEKSKLENEFKTLRGPNRYDGTYNVAYEEQALAKKELEKATERYRIQLGTSGTYNQQYLRGLTTQDMIDNFALAATDLRLQAERQQIIEKNKLFEVKSKVFESIEKRVNEIAEVGWDATIVGGRLFEVGKELEPKAIEDAAKDEIAKQARFYEELGKEITKENGANRSKALNGIFNGNDSQSINSDATTSTSQGATGFLQGIEEFLGAPDVKQGISNIIQFLSQPTHNGNQLPPKSSFNEGRSTPTTSTPTKRDFNYGGEVGKDFV